MRSTVAKLANEYSNWLSDVEWQYLITLHFNAGRSPSIEAVTRAVKQMTSRLHCALNGRRGRPVLSVFPVLETSKGGVPHVHMLLGAENQKQLSSSSIAKEVARLWARQEYAVNPLQLGANNEGWFIPIVTTPDRVIEYVCKDFKKGEDPVLVGALNINITK
jgi:hypothetical protein